MCLNQRWQPPAQLIHRRSLVNSPKPIKKSRFVTFLQEGDVHAVGSKPTRRWGTGSAQGETSPLSDDSGPGSELGPGLPGEKHDADFERRRRLLIGMALTLVVLIPVGALMRHVERPFPPASRWALCAGVLASALVPFLIRVLGLRLAGAIPPIVLTLVPVVMAYDQAGLFTPVLFVLPIAPITALFFGGALAGAVTTTCSILSVVWLELLHVQQQTFAGMGMGSEELGRVQAHTLMIAVLMAAAFGWLYERERIRRESHLRDSQVRYALAAAGSLDGFYEYDFRSGQTFYSPRFKKLLGHAPNAALLTELPELAADASRAALLEALEPMKTGEGQLDLDLQMRTASGATHWFQLRGLSWRAVDGSVRIAGSIRDISARKHAEELKDEFVSTVSHELRTPLTSMRGALSLLQNGVVGELPGQARSLLDVACRNTDRLRTLVDDLLDLQRMQTGNLKLQRQSTDLVTLLRESLVLNAGLEQVHGVHFQLVGEGPLFLDIDPQKIQQVMTNLLSNASKFSPSGQSVLVEACATGEYAQVRVTDRGGGVPPEFEPMLFEKFAQADGGPRRHHQGSGLGLSICRGIVNAHDGSIRYLREGGRTVFEIQLPRPRPSRAA